MLLLLSGDINFNPGPLHNDQLQPLTEWSVFNSRGLHFTHFNVNSSLLKINELEILPNYLMQQLQALVNENWTIPFSYPKYAFIIMIHFPVIGRDMEEG